MIKRRSEINDLSGSLVQGGGEGVGLEAEYQVVGHGGVLVPQPELLQPLPVEEGGGADGDGRELCRILGLRRQPQLHRPSRNKRVQL